MDKKIVVIDERYGDYIKAGPFSSVRLDSVDDDSVTLLCDDSRVRVSWGFGIFIDDADDD